MLLSAIAGIDMRTTKDLDTTIRGGGTVQDFENIIRDIITVDLDDQIKFKFVRSEEIVLENDYPCCRIHMRALLGAMDNKVELDVTTGDVITPREIEFGFPTLFGDEKIQILAYTLETVLAEKMTAILDLGVFNTRAKDFYDVYLLTSTQSDKLDKAVLAEAFRNTLHRRKKEGLLTSSRDVLYQTVNSRDMQTQWKRYRAEYPYAADIDFKQIVSALSKLFTWAGIEINIITKEPRASTLEQLQRNQKTIDAGKATKKDTPDIPKKPRSHDIDL